MNARDARHAREDAEAAAREAARWTQEQCNAFVTEYIAQSGRPRRKVAVPVVADVLPLMTSRIATGSGRVRGTLADGRPWVLECTNRWSGHHFVIG